MEAITSRARLKEIITGIIALSVDKNNHVVIAALQNEILSKKIRFPLLEFVATELYRELSEDELVSITDRIIALRTIGGNVLAGIILQLRLPQYFDESISKASEYIIAGNEWYVCDIIGARVYGHALLTMPDRMIPLLHKMAVQHDKWIVRSIGVAAHYAIKKGLKQQYVDEVFQLLLSLSSSTEFHTKKGIGWAAKTTAKFHPGIIEKYRQRMDNEEVKQWFKTKIKIGLGRTDKYAGRFTS